MKSVKLNGIGKILLGKSVSVLQDRGEHIEKHGLNMTSEEVVGIADKFTEGMEGLHICDDESYGRVTIAVRGMHFEEGKSYGIVRTLWKGDAGRKSEGTGLPIFEHIDSSKFTCNKHGFLPPYSHGFCPWCN